MSDKKISQLTASTTPLAGTEVLPIVQSGVTKKTSVESVATATQPSGTANAVVFLNATKVPTTSSKFSFDGTNINLDNAAYFGFGGSLTLYGDSNVTVVRGRAVNGISFQSFGAAEQGQFDASGNFKVNNGNVIVGTSGKGIDFSADGQAAGMTSELLDDYEEGTFTPVPTSSSGTITSYTSSGNYTKIGDVVTAVIYIKLDDVGTASGDMVIAGLPYASKNTVGHADVTLAREQEVSGVFYNAMVLSNAANAYIFQPAFINGRGYAFTVTYLAV